IGGDEIVQRAVTYFQNGHGIFLPWATSWCEASTAASLPRACAGRPAGPGSSRMQKNGVKGTDLLVPRCGEGRGTAPLGAAPRWREQVPALLRSSRGRSQVPDADQVVNGQAEDEHPAHAAGPAVSSLAQEPDGFEPAQDFLDALAFPLTHSVAVVARGAPIDRTRSMRRVLGYVRRPREQT